MTPTTHPDQICETLKLTVNSASEESISNASGDTINDLVTQIKNFLNENRNDGNKIYEVLAVATDFMGTPLKLTMAASSILEDGSDVYVTVRVSVDKKKHIAPISSTPIAPPTKEQVKAKQEQEKLLKFVTVKKYSYFESGQKFIKVLLPDFKDLNKLPCDRISVSFPTHRSFFVEVVNFKGQDWKFGVPRTQCRIVPEECSY